MKHAKPTAWLDEVRKAVANREELLVVCRTAATEREVYRQLERWTHDGLPAGWPGLQVTTLTGLARAAAPRRLVPPTRDAQLDVPPDHPWQTQLAERPGLRRHLRRHAERAHCLKAAGADLDGLRPEIQALLAGGWSCPDHLDGCRCLLAGDEPQPRAIAVGFCEEPFTFLGQVTALERAILKQLEAAPAEAGAPADDLADAIPARWVPDVAAEARVAAAEAAAEPDTLILVADAPTEDRIRAALRRNGIACAADGSSPLTHHTLAGLLRRFLPLFASNGTEPLDAEYLLHLTTDPVLARSPPDDGWEAIDGVERPFASVRHVHELFRQARRVRGTLDDWLATFEKLAALRNAELAQAEPESVDSARARLVSAVVLLAQVRTLGKHARAGGRLGDLARLVTALKLSAPREDRLAHAIVGALSDDGHRPADEDAFDEAISGGISSGRVDRGVQVLRYDQYDGRPSAKLILTGVHDKGLAKAPPPDPFLDEPSRRALGLTTAERAVAERLALARWAVSRAGASLALVTETDASGRSVSPPVLLQLALPDRKKLQRDSYGLAVDLPEKTDRDAYGPGRGERDAVTVQIDAEWARAGSAFEAEAPVAALEKGASLSERIDRDLGRFPADLRPWLGMSDKYPGGSDGLPPDFTLSATRLRHVSQCMYRGFVDSVLRLKTRDEVEEDVDPMELGNAVHRALELATPGLNFLVPAATAPAAREKLLAALRQGLEQGMKDALAARGLPDATDALRQARESLVARWQRHWEDYVKERIADVEGAEERERKAALKSFKKTTEFEAIWDVLGEGLSDTARGQLGSGIINALIETRADAQAMRKAGDTIVGKIKGLQNGTGVRARLTSASTVRAIDDVCEAAKPLIEHIDYNLAGDLEVVAREHSFGRSPHGDPDAKPCDLTLGRATIPVHGRIDQVVLRRGRKGNAGRVRISDYKTGKSLPKADSLTKTLTEPQLALYALALEHLGLPALGKQPVVVEQVRIDGVGALKQARDELTREAAERARTVLGRLLDLARDGFYPALPHPDACPLFRDRGAYCDFEKMCRVRPSFGPDEEEPDSDDAAGQEVES